MDTENVRKKEWAKYKAYFIQQLKQQLGKDAKILFLDDDKNNTNEAKKVGVATVNIKPEQRALSQTSIAWTIKALLEIFGDVIDKSLFKTDDLEESVEYEYDPNNTQGAVGVYDLVFNININESEQISPKSQKVIKEKIKQLAVEAVTDL